MRPLALFSISGAVVWAGLSLAVVTQDPDVAVHATAACPAAAAWRAAMAAEAFNLEEASAEAIADHRARVSLPDRLVGCVSSRVGGYLIEGPLPPAAVTDLMREHPRGVTAVAVDGDDLVALRLDGSIVPLAEALDD